MQLSVRELERIFRKLELHEKESTHHVAGWLEVDGKRVLALHYSRGRKDMPGHVPDRFRRSMLLERDEFSAMKNCTMSRAQYVELLRKRGAT